MEYSIPIPRGKSGMERNGMEWNLEYSMVEPTSRNLDRDLAEKKKQKKSGMVGRPTQPFQILQKRGLVNDLDSLKNELWNAILAKKRKKTPKNELWQAPILVP